jgi:Kef-type K+ transport system membrane component KefB
MGLPFAAGLLLAIASRSLIAGSSAHPAAFMLFVGLAISVTALPVLARILIDLRLQRTPEGVIALSSAAIGDGVAWAVLTLTLALSSMDSGAGAGTTLALTAALVLMTFLVVRPALAAGVRWLETRNRAGQLLLPLLAAGALALGAISELIGLHAVIGAFLFGTVLPRNSNAIAQVTRQMQGFAVIILLPLFFAGVGLNTSIWLLGGDAGAWLLLGAVLVVATGAKFAGAGGGALLAGMRGREVWRLGALMNCRGVTELVVASIGWNYGLINSLGLTVLVLMALVTTAATGPLLRVFGVPAPVNRSVTAAKGPR